MGESGDLFLRVEEIGIPMVHFAPPPFTADVRPAGARVPLCGLGAVAAQRASPPQRPQGQLRSRRRQGHSRRCGQLHLHSALISGKGGSIYDVRTEGGGGLDPKQKIVLIGCVSVIVTRGKGAQKFPWT